MYERSEKYEQLGKEVINDVPELLYLANIPICFMASDKRKRKSKFLVYGECIKVNELSKDFCPYEFLIVVYEPNTERFNEQQFKILLEHELLHVGVEYDDFSGEIIKTYINDHDYTDFKQIANKYGVDWDKQGE